MSNCCIIVPVYKQFSQLNDDELLSLKQLFKVLNRHTIYLVGPSFVKWEVYIENAQANNVVIHTKEFADELFESIEGYNKLLISPSFYRYFKKYKYVLIYQLDAYVFNDHLEEWCSTDYDYIGAPWFDSWRRCDPNAKIIGVGNGGFSLRNISKATDILKRIEKLRSLKKFWDKYSLERIIKYSKMIILLNRYFKIKEIWELPSAMSEEIDNEDIFWGVYVKNAFADFKVASVKDAIKFSFEVNPRELYELNGKQLPFGCHAWEKFDPEFWSKFIHPSNSSVHN